MGHEVVADTLDHRFSLVSLTPEEKESFHVSELTVNMVTPSHDIVPVSIHFTSLPIVHIQADTTSKDFAEGRITLHDPILPTARHICTLQRWRGASSMSRTKKSFALKLQRDNGVKLDTTLLGLRSDNSWILDAMAIDRSRMRNRISLDLWNEFSTPSYVTQYDLDAHNGTDGCFVEVFYNNHYEGIYCLSEKLDRKQLKLMKHKGGKMHGAIYKTDKWAPLKTPETPYDNTSSTWGSYTIDYPSLDDGEPIDWEPLDRIITYLNKSSTNVLRASLPDKIDLPVWLDYFLFIELLMADDNMSKNQYFYFYDTDADDPMGIAPWDLDHSWGRNYKGDLLAATRSFSIVNQAHTCLRRYYGDTFFLGTRYCELRQTYFQPDALKARFARVFELFRTSGAGQREELRWGDIDGIHLDFGYEQSYIEDWITQRIAVLDDKYDYLFVGIDTPPAHSKTSSLSLNTTPGCLHLLSDSDQSVTVHSLQGFPVATLHLQANEPARLPLSRGIYIIEGKKVMIR